jgi:hypothetical protein
VQTDMTMIGSVSDAGSVIRVRHTAGPAVSVEPVCRDRLVHTHPVLGIGAPEVLAALQEKLAGMCSLDRE